MTRWRTKRHRRHTIKRGEYIDVHIYRWIEPFVVERLAWPRGRS